MIYNYNKLTPFKKYIIQNFPYIDADFDALTNYELYAKVVEYLNKTIDSVNNQNEFIEQLTNKFNDLVNNFDNLELYVNNYFENLDVQDEINKKLDEMVTTGQLQELVGNIFNSLQDQINSIASGSPAGTYATLTDLTTADPDHSKIYLVLDTGYWYYYNKDNSQWTSGGLYQASQNLPNVDNLISNLGYEKASNMQVNKGTISSNGKWIAPGSISINDTNFIYIPLTLGDNVKIVGNTTAVSYISFLNSITIPVVHGSSADFSTQYTTRVNINANVEREFTVESSMNYIMIQMKNEGNNIAPSSIVINGIDLYSSLDNNLTKIFDKYNETDKEIKRAFSLDNIKKAYTINEIEDLNAHVSSIVVTKNGYAYCIYFANKNKDVEDYSETSDAKLILAKFNIAKPYDVEYQTLFEVGTITDKYEFIGNPAPANPLLFYDSTNNIIKIFFYVGCKNLIDNATSDREIMVEYDVATDSLIKDENQKIITHDLLINYYNVNYNVTNDGLEELYTALEYTVTDPGVQMTCNFIKFLNKYYTVISGLSFKALLVSTIDFVNYELENVIDDRTNVITPEFSIQAKNNGDIVFMYRSNDENTKGNYWGIWNKTNNTFTYKGMLSDSDSKPLIIKDYKNTIYFIYNIAWNENNKFKRRGISIDIFNQGFNSLVNIYKYNKYPYNIHYLSNFLYGTENFISFTSGKKYVKWGHDYDSIQLIQFGYN